MNLEELRAKREAGIDVSLEELLGPATPDLLEPEQIIVVVRYRGKVTWHCSDRDYWVLDHKRWGAEGSEFGFDVAPFDPGFRGGLEIVDTDNAEAFLGLVDNHKMDLAWLRKALLERFQGAQSWWDVGFLFPVAFVDFDHKRFAGFYHDGPRLERYVPEGWVGEFVDFANTYPEEIFPAADKFWIVDGVDLLTVLNERGAEKEVASKS